ncbi:MAG: NF038129 family PEP-CTERM protein [Terriglobales bacterium]
MKSPQFACLALAAAFGLAAAALPARADSISASVVLNTSGLTGGGPFEVNFQLNDGSGSGDGNNTLTLSNFDFGTGSAGSVDTANSSNYSGTLASGFTLKDTLAFNNVAAFFTPGNQISFDLTDSYTSLDSPEPDDFVFQIYDGVNLIPTTATDGTDSLIELNITTTPSPLLYGGDGSDGNGASFGTAAPTFTPSPATVPEPAPLLLLATGLGLLLAFRARRSMPAGR